MAGLDDLGRPAVALWHPLRYRRAVRQRREDAEADAEQARAAVLEAAAQLTQAQAATGPPSKRRRPRGKPRRPGCGPALKMPMVEALKMPMAGNGNAPPVGAAGRCDW